MIFFYSLSIFLSAFLLFLVQPIIGKQVLPWFGGSAGVWSVCLAFFQTALLAGYIYADYLSRKQLPFQAVLHTLLLGLATLTLPIVANEAFKPTASENPSLQILLLLGFTVAMPYFLLSSTGPLLQAWAARSTQKASTKLEQIYRLFALSNLASLIALLSYPFLIEPYFSVSQQAKAWSGLFVVFAFLCTACTFLSLKKASLAQQAFAKNLSVENSRNELKPSVSSYLLWLILPSLACVLLLSITTHITQNVASVPFLWLLPLCLYLLTFILCFESGVWYRRWLFYPLLIALLPLMAWGLSKDNAVLSFKYALPLYCMGLFVGCMFCHGELARIKPQAQYLTRFYLFLSLGGAIGGISVSLLAPLVFVGYWELPLALIMTGLMLWLVNAKEALLIPWLSACLFALGLWGLFKWTSFGSKIEHLPLLISIVGSGAFVLAGIGYLKHRSGTALAATLGLMAAICTTVLFNVYIRTLKDGTVQMERNFYGTVRVRQNLDGRERRLSHGVILHGMQFTDLARHRIATTYYSETSGAGLAVRYLREQRQRPLRIGIIGLGVGTMAAYAHAGDWFGFYEINPQVIDLAKTQFTYLAAAKNAGAALDIIGGDARLALEKQSSQQFDVLLVDAFSSDAIPVHLLTTEALRVYSRHLAAGGIVAFHVSNRYLELQPVVKQLAKLQNLHAFWISDEPAELYLSRSDYVLVSADPDLEGKYPFMGRSTPIKTQENMKTWTDDYNNVFDVLKL